MLPYCSGCANSKSDKNRKSVDFVTEIKQLRDKFVPQKRLRHQIAPVYGPPRQHISFHSNALGPARRSQHQRSHCRAPCACKNLSGVSQLVIRSARRRCAAKAPNRAPPLTSAHSEEDGVSLAIALNTNNRPPDGCLETSPNTHTRICQLGTR